VHCVLADEGVEAPPAGDKESLWEYLHRADLELWSQRNYLLLPVLVLDQFEEVFTRGDQIPDGADQLRIDLGDLAENRIPAWLEKRLADDAAIAHRLDLRTLRHRIVVCLREDFLPDLESWRREVPSLGRKRVRLLPMRQDQALSAVLKSARHLLDEGIAREIVRFVAAERAPHAAGERDVQPGTVKAASSQAEQGGDRAAVQVEPALLSLFCHGLNERRLRQGKERFDANLLETARQGIIADYFHSCVAALPEDVGRFIESELITLKGFRSSFAREDAVPARLTEDQLDLLVKKRLLRVEERYGTHCIELTHDLLTSAVRESRDRRREQDERAAQARKADEEKRAEIERAKRIEQARLARKLRWLASGLGLALVAALLAGWVALQQREAALQQRNAAIVARAQAEGLVNFMVIDLRDKLLPIGRLDLLQDLVSRVSAYYQSVGAGGTPDQQHRWSEAESNRGDLLVSRGKLGEALRAYDASRAIRERLAKQDPSNAQWQRDLAASQTRIGGVLQAQGKLGEALQAYEASQAITEWLAKQDPSNAKWQRDLSVSQGNIGDILQAQGKLGEALRAYEASRAIAEQLAKQDPSNAQWQHDLSISQGKIGEVLQAQGKLGEALQAYEASRAIAERLAKQDPSNAQWQRDLELANARIARLRRQS
jgi:tetratricopeptide (TPR) repeat protein